MPSTGTVLHFSGNKKTCFGKPLLSLDEMESINLKYLHEKGKGPSHGASIFPSSLFFEH